MKLRASKSSRKLVRPQAMGNDGELRGITALDLRDDALDIYMPASHITSDVLGINGILSVLSILGSIDIIGVIKTTDD